jgi:hypothetical protein
MSSDVADAIPRLVEAGVLPPDEAPRLLRVARGELLSVHWELRALLYVGVLLATGGVGLLVKENLDRIGPVAIAVGIGLAAAVALGWVIRVAPAFSWREVPSPNLAFDYVLLLGVLLAAADLAYVEVKFTPLGANWSWHLLIVAAFAALAAFRFDSRVVFSLALSTFAAWRGVSAARFGMDLWWKGAEDAVRWNAIACGALFVVLGFSLKRTGRKAHFEPVAVTLGWLLILGALASGMDAQVWWPWTVALLLTGLGLAAVAFLVRRFPLFAFGVVAAYAALSRLALDGTADTLGCFWFFLTPILVIAGLILAQRRLKEPL